ncbi:MAG: enoyl-CoA hydratase/isomerase family protein [Candidatus Abyssobacteria bacterium SURF_5]|uniref:Enoyl-CoA hydratase/isomerase family protein n=1 Tax=Abyssobacteria bacterium (strain SURF_5) TaxID=2093360 RepID=A0A3A4P1T0_ABYX5|nr:MAG: enoyl-CoA hydratase/isomerase family protein [Candidatus Abyssubacteria bacterium SURF_5]
MSELIKINRNDEVCEVLLNRPQSFNAFNLEMIELLANRLIGIAMDDTVLAVIISGEGKAFCAGGDLKWALEQPSGRPAAFHELAARYHQAILEIRRMKKPVVAAINGVAAGGGFSLALACDFRVMAKSAIMRQAYTSAGLCIDGGGTFSLPRVVGVARAMEIMAFDKPISSEQALAWGLVNKAVDDGRVMEEARTMAHDLLKGSIHSFGWCKELIADSFNTPFEMQLERERAALSTCAAHPDGKEGLTAFAEKRKPVFNRR